MVRNRKELENFDFSSMAATMETATTHVFAGSLIRNAEVRGSTPSVSKDLGDRHKLFSLIRQRVAQFRMKKLKLGTPKISCLIWWPFGVSKIYQ
jgi:hypothetical protein